MLRERMVKKEPEISPLVLADRLLRLAEAADRAGYAGPARRLLKLAVSVCGERPA